MNDSTRGIVRHTFRQNLLRRSDVAPAAHDLTELFGERLMVRDFANTAFGFPTFIKVCQTN